MRHAFVRFVVHEIDRGSGRRRGIFQAADDLVDSKTLDADHLRALQELRRWFDEHLKKPDQFWRGRKSHGAHVAISWFKSSSVEHIRRIRQMCIILKENGVVTEMITSARPGYVVFEDDHQVAAIPFADTAT